VSDNARDVLKDVRLSQLIECFVTPPDKPFSQKKVFRGIATDGKLGNDQQVGIGFNRFLGGIQNLLTIAGNVSDRGIDLGKSNFHDE
jgi:hypothetical protein